MIYEIGGYKQLVKKGSISCTCRHGTIYCNNYKKGEKLCKHIKKVMELEKTNNENIQSR